MLKVNYKKLNLIRLYKRDLWGRIIQKRKLLLIRNYIIKLYKLKNKFKRKKRVGFYRINNFEKPVYFRRKTKYGKYFILRRQFRIFYGFLSIKMIKKIIKKSFRKRYALCYFIYLMESRIDVLVYRLHIVKSVRSARQWIFNGNVIINNNIIINPGYNVKKGDLILFNKNIMLLNKTKLYKCIKSKNWSRSLVPNYLEYDLNNFIFTFINFNVYDVPFFAPVTPYTFLNIMNFYTKFYF